MKKFLIYLSVAIMQIMTAFAAEKTESFSVYGNCGMCKKTIEKAVNTLEGIKTVSWSKKTKKLSVTFDDTHTSLAAIKKSIADSGYDMEDIRASDEAYSSLHTCCQYDRPAKK